MSQPPPRIGYIGVDVLNNATVCNEATGLLAAGVPLEVCSVYRHASATFYQDASLEALRASIQDLSPLRPAEVLGAILGAPFRFGWRFPWAAWRAVVLPAEGLKQRLTLLYQFLPALVLATRWRRRGIGHIHAHWAHTATAVAMHAAALLGVGFSFTGHANDLFVHRVGLLAKVRRARFVVCISEFHRQFYLEMGADPARLPVVYCGIDTARFGPESGAPAAGPVIVAVGRLVEKKGFHHLIEACALLRDRGVDFRCVIAGSGPDLDRLRAQVERAGLADRVELPGQTVLQEGLPGLLRSARLTALPCVRDRDGDMDGLPQVLIEAMACGVPAVSTVLVGIPDLVRDGDNGLLVAPGDVPALADALQDLLGDPERSVALGRRAEVWAKAHFGRDETVRRLARLFREAAATPGQAPLEYRPTSALAIPTTTEYAGSSQ